ncbi:MAG: heparan-alpha-glucosaminide N-acetyltransferase domain-containing protein [Bacteroidota bacterium]
MKSRLVFIDLLRGWATIVMIEVHIFNAFIIPAFKETGWFRVLNYINGLVAPSFLFVAGFVFVIASQRKLEEFRTFGKAFWRQLARIGLIWAIGYALHIPFFSFSRTITATTDLDWLKFYQADILHCIAVGLLAVFLGRIVIKRDVVYQWYLIIIGSAVVLVTPLIWEIDFVPRVPAVIAAYLNGQHYSQFPVFPWLGFLMFGAVTAIAYTRWRASEKEIDFLRTVGILSGVLIVAGSLLIELPVRLAGVSTATGANPLFFASRLGIVLILMLICWYYVEKRKTERSFVVAVSRESLLVYTAHLLFIYGQFWDDKSLTNLYGGTFGIGQCVMAALGLILLMITSAKLWGWLKQRSLPAARIASYATALIVILVFFIKKS